MTKRLGNLWDKLVSYDNVKTAYQNARKGKTHRPDVREVDSDPEGYIREVCRLLESGEYHTSPYRMFEIHEKGKTRLVADLPFFPDRIVHWALILVLHDMLMRNLIPQTYAALPGRGAHQAATQIRKALHDDKAQFYLQLDIAQYFPSIDKQILMEKLTKRVKDRRVLELCERIIEEYSGPGLPIGNYTSQYFANFYLSDLDHFMKERFHCKWYFRYMDDIVIIGWSKAWLRRCLRKISGTVEGWGLSVKGNWCIRPASEGIDFVGFRSFRTSEGDVFVLLRKRTKIRMRRACVKVSRHMREGLEPSKHDRGVIASYNGCLKWCDSYHLGCKTVYPLLNYVGIQNGGIT
jgi:hypothetical protein